MYSVSDIVNRVIDYDRLADWVSQGNLSVDEYRHAAGAFIFEGDFDAAFFVVERALEEKKEPGHSLLKGDILLAQGRVDDAKAEWWKTGHVYKNADDMVLARIAFSCYIVGDVDGALEYLKKCISDKDAELCKMLIDFDNGINGSIKNSQNVILQSQQTSLISEFFTLMSYLDNPKIDKLPQDIITTALWLKAWLPFPTIEDVADTVLGLKNVANVSRETLMRLQQKLAVAVMLLLQKTEKKGEKLSILRKGLASFPENADLIKLYVDLAPTDHWLVDHLVNHDSPVPNTISYMMNQESGQVFSTEYIDSISENSKKVSITALGGGRSIGASAYVISNGGRSIMLDCGLNPNKSGPDAYPELDRWNYEIDAIILSHGHLDHCGALPKAHAMWKNALIYGTEGTRSVVELLFNDMLRINRRNHEREIYTDTIEEQEMQETLNSFVALEFLTWKQIFDNCKIRFHQAGHIAGAAMVEIFWDGVRIIFTGDFCLHNQKLLKGADLSQLPQTPDILITEATYAFKKNITVWDKQLEDLLEAIKTAISNGGTVLLPSFAIGRSQELVYAIGEAYEQGFLGEHIDFILGGMAHEACHIAKIVLKNPLYNRYLSGFSKLTHNEPIPVRSVIVASSGMMIKNSASYNIMHEIRNSYNADNSRIFFCGYMDEETERENKQLISGKSGLKYDRYSLTAHAAAEDIQLLVKHLRPKSIAYVHWGDSKSQRQAEYIDKTRKRMDFDCMAYALRENQTIYPCDVNRWLIHKRG